MGSVSMALPFDDRWFFAEVLRGAREHVEAAGHELWTHVVPPAPDATVAVVREIERDFSDGESLGAIVVGFKYRADQRARALAFERPVAVIGGSVMGYPTVMIDDIGAARTATQHLLDLGHRRIAHFAGELDDQMDFSVHGRRARGYRQAMEQAGLEPVLVEVDFDDRDVRGKALPVLDADDRPTAIFAVSDEVAFPIMASADDLGLQVGKDLSLVGFDDHPRAEAANLTTMRQRPDEQGAAAADLLLSGIGHGPDPTRSRLMSTQLIHRGSTHDLRKPF